MDIKRLFRSYWFRLVFGVLFWWSALVGLVWLLHSRYGWLKHLAFSDVLFVVGVLECLTASLGMMTDRLDVMLGGPYGSPAVPAQSSEDEKRWQMVAGFMERKSFGIRLMAIGLLTIFLSAALTFL